MAYTEINAAKLLRRYRRENPEAVPAFHVTPALKGGWNVRRTGAIRALQHFADQAAAIEFARSLAQQERSGLFVQRRDGTVAEMTSYGSEPLPRRSTR
jgi:hypothetical protein